MSACSWFYFKKFIMMHSHMNVNFYIHLPSGVLIFLHILFINYFVLQFLHNSSHCMLMAYNLARC